MHGFWLNYLFDCSCTNDILVQHNHRDVLRILIYLCENNSLLNKKLILMHSPQTTSSSHQQQENGMLDEYEHN
jgi:hypothetical protein